MRAELFRDQTTSHGAAGYWEPYKLGTYPSAWVSSFGTFTSWMAQFHLNISSAFVNIISQALACALGSDS